MRHSKASIIWLIIVLLGCTTPQNTQIASTTKFDNPSKPWTFWYWMKGYVSKEGITADLEAMKEIGLGGAYLMPIQGPDENPLYEPTAVQLTPEWWEMIRHAFSEAKRLDFQLGLHASDGFALAGGPWITPELSMQKVVWTVTNFTGGHFEDTLRQPEAYEGYYEDIAVFAFPNKVAPKSSFQTKPTITTSTGENADFLVVDGNKEQFRCEEDCWFQYSFSEPFTVQSIQVITKGNNYQSHRLKVLASDDGEDFQFVYQMTPPRHGWQDTDEQATYSIPKTTAKHFRFVWELEGTEPGAEDLDAAKWSPRMKIAGLELNSQPKIHQFEGKSGAVWRISPRTTEEQLPSTMCINPSDMINLTDLMDENGVLNWEVPQGNWIILRMGHTSTGHTNYTGGGGLGLECDKFNPKAINTQFDGWYGRIVQEMGSDLTSALKAFHVDSWECGSQNWSPVFREEFIKRRGYDPVQFLPVMAGFPISNTKTSEQFLHDVRETISELTIDNFYGIMAKRAHEQNVQFSAESVAPTMVSDGMRHYSDVDLPMGEFWLRSPTHDKPNDMLDAISGAHVYGKNIVQAEGFTELRMMWDEHPAMLKPLIDRNFALGVNRLFFHVQTHNPWLDRAPGITLGTVGLFFNRDQTWWKPGKAFVAYIERCQQLLQEGRPVTDVAVFTGECLPRRSILPDRLLKTLPGVFGEEVVESERIRMQNEGQPQRRIPKDVKHSANMADPENWLDPLNGYKYDSFNKDALLRLASVNDGRIVLSTGASYDVLVLPGVRRMNPNPEYMSLATLKKLYELIEDGAKVVISQKPEFSPGIDKDEKAIQKLAKKIWGGNWDQTETLFYKSIGKGVVFKSPILWDDFSFLELAPDFQAFENDKPAKDIAWSHRKSEKREIYFISNQQNQKRSITVSLRVIGKLPEIYDPVTGEGYAAENFELSSSKTEVHLSLYPNQSLFILLENESKLIGQSKQEFKDEPFEITGNWKLTFDTLKGGPKEPVFTDTLTSWTSFENPQIKYYSGTATYEVDFDIQDLGFTRPNLQITGLHDIAEVILNGQNCGVIWTAPYQIDLSKALKPGENHLEIQLTNTWRNRLLYDHTLPEEEQLTWTTAPYWLEGESLLDAGITGKVSIVENQHR